MLRGRERSQHRGNKIHESSKRKHERVDRSPSRDADLDLETHADAEHDATGCWVAVTHYKWVPKADSANKGNHGVPCSQPAAAFWNKFHTPESAWTHRHRVRAAALQAKMAKVATDPNAVDPRKSASEIANRDQLCKQCEGRHVRQRALRCPRFLCAQCCKRNVPSEGRARCVRKGPLGQGALSDFDAAGNRSTRTLEVSEPMPGSHKTHIASHSLTYPHIP